MPSKRNKPRPPYPANRGMKQAYDSLRKTRPAPDRKKVRTSTLRRKPMLPHRK